MPAVLTAQVPAMVGLSREQFAFVENAYVTAKFGPEVKELDFRKANVDEPSRRLTCC